MNECNINAMDKASQKRSEIIDAAYRVITRKGYHATRIEDIAQELGMAQGLFYRYFRNKLEIFNEIVDEIIMRITEGMASAPPTLSNTLGEYTEQMRGGLENSFAILTEDPFISRAMFFEAYGIDEEISKKVQDVFDLFGEYSSYYVRHGIDKGILRQDLDVEKMGFAFNALVFEGVRRIIRSNDKEAAKAAWVKAILGLMIQGTADAQALEELRRMKGFIV
ncbi:MAG: hypothetical protein A2W01_08640 [Candidatus Solincola sediminis]|uniref:HTH tetR-type domain-containing protein n=1 Tax=Candidatus Solincola sediminis TaxID=1797199 RepID=A0A1F2WSX1_9ACTN|nr:MAG: hypothetical protein A2Y75_07845 [Candidatus Solincola sediminis]OFW60199.1 MAG: hypothetical protein A2W01_08640 [Candidatus Solincola sediminis]